MRDSADPSDAALGHERRIVVASLVASLGIHAAAIGLLPPIATPAVEALPPINVTLRALAPDPPETAADAAPPGDGRPSFAAVPHEEPAAPPERPATPKPRERARIAPQPTRAANPGLRAPTAPSPPAALVAVAPALERAPVEPPGQEGGAPVPAADPAAPEPLRQAAAPASTQPSFRARHLSNPPPVYPRRARRDGIEGTVTLKVLVTATGAPGRVELDSSSGSEVLDRAAIEAVKRWEFVPARRGDAPVDAWVRVPVIFRLQRG